MAKIRLGAEAHAVEMAIESGTEHDALARLIAAGPVLGRRPEYRYLRYLFDHVFGARPEGDILRDVVELVGEQPDLPEATALVAELYGRCGDFKRADLFARIALDSDSPSARRRAQALLDRFAAPAGGDGGDAVGSSAANLAPTGGDGAGSTAARAKSPVEAGNEPAPFDVEGWFRHAAEHLVQRRSATYGVRSSASPVDRLLQAARELATGPSAFSATPLALNRASLAQIDQRVIEARKTNGSGTARPSEARTTEAAGFLLAVLLRELGGTAVETAPNDGGCKVLVGSGAGARPLLAASAFLQGTGPGLAQTYDRLAASLDLASTGDRAPSAPRVRAASSPRGPALSGAAMPAPARGSGAMAPAQLGVPSVAGPLGGRPSGPMTRVSAVSTAGSDRLNVPVSTARSRGHGSSASRLALPLAVTREEAEAQAIRRLDGPRQPGASPDVDLTSVAFSLSESAFGAEIRARNATELVPNAQNVEAIERYLSKVRGRVGVAPDQPTWQPSSRDEALILSCGAFLGEAIIAMYGGVWEADPAAPADARLYRVICQDRAAIWPMTQVYLRLKAGAPHDLVGFLSLVRRILN